MLPSSKASDGGEPIAIVGLACRLPGNISSPSRLWENLAHGRSCHTDIPSSRFNAQAFYHPNHQYPATVNGLGGYFLNEDVRAFDNELFGINNLEAQYMDPQQRQLLEVTFECLESAGIPLHLLSNAEIGCYVANFTVDYMILQTKDPESYHRYSATGMGSAILANRISHTFNLKGPSLTVDTACSSSLYALHLACNALRNGECDRAIVGGANLIQSPEVHIAVAKAGMSSASSKCHAFDEAADGYGRAEGVGVLYVKRLNDAVRDGDPIRSVIRGTAVNSNGMSKGITLPLASGQEAVIQKAYINAGLPTNNTDYVEAHGTGTEVGDGVEVDAISRALQHHSGRPTLIGSVKTNLGHSEAVSGITSILKVTLALEHGVVPPTIGISQLNPKLELEDRNITIAMENTLWPTSTVKRASINSFGYGGSNGHLILEAAQHHCAPISNEAGSKSNDNYIVLPFSASSPQSLERRRLDLADYNLHQANPRDFAFTLTCRRSHLTCRGFLVASEASFENDIVSTELKVGLSGQQSPNPSFLFVFTGQGSQWSGMGCILMKQSPIFAQCIIEMSEHLKTLQEPPTWDLEDILRDSTSKDVIHQASISQPTCTAVQIAFVELLRQLAILPSTVIGHSSGEIAAAYTAGFLTAREAIAIAYYRGLVVSSQASSGAMAAVGLDEQSAVQLISEAEFQDHIQVACVNSPQRITVSGDVDAVDHFVAFLASRGTFVRKLETDTKAYHSRHMKAIGQIYAKKLAEPLGTLRKQNARTPSKSVKMISSVHCEELKPCEVASPDYWRQNLESQVRFGDALQAALSPANCHIIEIGPHNALKTYCKDVCNANGKGEVSYSAVMIRGKNSAVSLLELIGHLFLTAYEAPIEILNGASFQNVLIGHTSRSKVLTDLPTYSWRRTQPLWNESRISYEYRLRKHSRHDLLGSLIPGSSGQTLIWRNVLKVDDVPWLPDHKLGDTIVFPAAGYIAMAIEGFLQAQDKSTTNIQQITLQDVKLVKFLSIDDKNATTELFTELAPYGNTMVSSSNHMFQFTISTYDTGISTVHARGLITSDVGRLREPLHQWPSMGSLESQAPRVWYRKLGSEGLNYGPAFQRLTEIQSDRSRTIKQTLASVDMVQSAHGSFESSYLLHPTIIDSVLQATIISTAAGATERLHSKVPTSIKLARFYVSKELTISRRFCIRASSELNGMHTAVCHAELTGSSGNSFFHLDGLEITSYRQYSTEQDGVKIRQPMLRINWKPDISLLRHGQNACLSQYVKSFAASQAAHFSSRCAVETAAVLDLLCHKAPATHRVLQLEPWNESDKKSLLGLLDSELPLRRIVSYHVGELSEDGKLMVSKLCYTQSRTSFAQDLSSKQEIASKAMFDIIIAPSFSDAAQSYISTLSQYLSPHGKLIGQLTDAEKGPLATAQPFSIAYELSQEGGESLIVLTKTDLQSKNRAFRSSRIILIVPSTASLAQSHLETKLLEHLRCEVDVITLDQVFGMTLPDRAVLICSFGLEIPFLSTMTEVELAALQLLARKASILIWLHAADLISASQPDFSLVQGLSRTLVLEQPALKFVVFDVGTTMDSETAGSVLSNLDLILEETLNNPQAELEYAQHAGELYISRFSPINHFNEQFRIQQDRKAIEQTLESVGKAKLHVQDSGRLDSLCFTPIVEPYQGLEPTYVEIRAKAFGINAKDFHVLKGSINTKDATCAIDFSGIITRVGIAVTRLRTGDRVVSMAPNNFETLVSVPEWACCKLEDNEDFATISSIGVVFSTAFYALQHRAQLKWGESILIHSAAGGVGIAAVQVAKLMGAKIFATVGTKAKKDFLVKQFGLERERIFSSRNTSFLPSILQATHGNGVDVVLNCLTGDLLRASWEACAEFGRFVDISKRDILDGGRLEMSAFGRHTSYHAFDLTGLYYSRNPNYNRTWQALLEQSLQMVRTGVLQPVEPLSVFDISDATKAFQHFNSSARIGKVAISLESPMSIVKYIPPKFRTAFSSDKTYFLIGCLGGLGRTVSQWMVQQGARHLSFLSRSGATRSAAKQQLEDLKRAGVEVQVLQGDVASLSDVEKAFSLVRHPIGGVMHAAMDLKEAIFTTQMTTEKWFACVNPKVRGAWNLHHALNGHDQSLDFFLMTSSIAGSVGNPTESNYCAANSFLDAFARYRSSLGLPALSIGLGAISEVGYLHEHPEIEETMLRRGVQPYTEDEMLCIIDIALSQEDRQAPHFTDAHVLTGFETQAMQKIIQRGFSVQNGVLNDPRAGLIARALEALQSGPLSGDASEKPHDGLSVRKEELNEMLGAGHPERAQQIAVEMAAEVYGNLLLLPAEKLLKAGRLADFGMDSMLAAEFRASMFKAFGVDVPFTVLTDEQCQLQDVASVIVKDLLRQRSK